VQAVQRESRELMFMGVLSKGTSRQAARTHLAIGLLDLALGAGPLDCRTPASHQLLASSESTFRAVVGNLS